jgi:hypothetical protein
MQDGVVPILEDALQYRLQYEVRKKLWKLYPPLSFTCNLLLFRCEAEGIRTPYPSAVQRRHDTLLERSVICGTPANCRISALALFPAFQEIHSGCCTVAAHIAPLGISAVRY